jgi:hypothetical protein
MKRYFAILRAFVLVLVLGLGGGAAMFTMGCDDDDPIEDAADEVEDAADEATD